MMNRPPESSSRSDVSIAVIVGDLGKARAMAVPTVILEVAWIAAAQVMKAVFVVSAAQQDSKPASSTILAIGPIIERGPPIPMPYSIGPDYSPAPSGPGRLAPRPALCTLPGHRHQFQEGIQRERPARRRRDRTTP